MNCEEELRRLKATDLKHRRDAAARDLAHSEDMLRNTLERVLPKKAVEDGDHYSITSALVYVIEQVINLRKLAHEQ